MDILTLFVVIPVLNNYRHTVLKRYPPGQTGISFRNGTATDYGGVLYSSISTARHAGNTDEMLFVKTMSGLKVLIFIMLLEWMGFQWQ